MIDKNGKMNVKLGIINPSDFTNKVVSGGSSGFLINILPYLNLQRTVIYGIGLNKTIPWKTYHLDKNIDFIPICNLKDSSKIPMRLKVLIYFIFYRKRILNSKMDVLYIQMPECCMPFLKNSMNIPVIYQKHGSANPMAYSKFRYGRTILFRLFFEYILNLIYKKAEWIIAIDSLTHKKILQKRKNKRTSLIMNAIDTKKFFPNNDLRLNARKRFSLKENDHAILFVGRIEKTKGPKLLLDCIPLLKKRDCSFHLFFAGIGSYQPYLKNYVLKKNYSRNVTFLGHVAYEDLVSIYNMSDVLVLPSETEGVPMVILESLSCGTPVISSNVGSIPDLVFNGINGIVLEDLSTKKISAAILNILMKKVKRTKIAFTVQKHSAKNFIKSFDNIVLNILNK